MAWLHVETLRGEIPLYISEILIALIYMKIMVTMYRKQLRSQAVEEFDPEENFQNLPVVDTSGSSPRPVSGTLDGDVSSPKHQVQKPFIESHDATC